MTQPKRSEDKYWKGTRDFDHIQFETDLEEYIDWLKESSQPQPTPPSDLYKALEKIDEGNLGSAKNLIKRFINTAPLQVEGLPDRDAVSEYADKHSNNFSGAMFNSVENEGIIKGAEWVKGIASAIIAKKDKEIQQANDCIQHMKDVTDEYEKELSELKEENNKAHAKWVEEYNSAMEALAKERAEKEELETKLNLSGIDNENLRIEIQFLKKENEQLKKRPSEGHDVSEFYKD